MDRRIRIFRIAMICIVIGAPCLYVGIRTVRRSRAQPRMPALGVILARSHATASLHEESAIFSAAEFLEKLKLGSLTTSHTIKTEQLDRDRPFPIQWKVTFTNPKTGESHKAQTFFSLSTVNDYLKVAGLP